MPPSTIPSTFNATWSPARHCGYSAPKRLLTGKALWQPHDVRPVFALSACAYRCRDKARTTVRRRIQGDAEGHCECRRTPSAIHEYGDLRVREHFDRLAAEDNRRDTATPVRGHHDQIAPSRRGGIDDRLIDVFVLDVQRLARDTG